MKAFKGAEIWLSDRAKEDIDRLGGVQHKRLGWQRHDGVAMKGFPGTFTLWAMQRHPLREDVDVQSGDRQPASPIEGEL